MFRRLISLPSIPSPHSPEPLSHTRLTANHSPLPVTGRALIKLMIRAHISAAINGSHVRRAAPAVSSRVKPPFWQSAAQRRNNCKYRSDCSLFSESGRQR
jgi:hypothetical protein